MKASICRASESKREHLTGDSKGKDYPLHTLPRAVLTLFYTALRLKVLSNTPVRESPLSMWGWTLLQRDLPKAS